MKVELGRRLLLSSKVLIEPRLDGFANAVWRLRGGVVTPRSGLPIGLAPIVRAADGWLHALAAA